MKLKYSQHINLNIRLVLMTELALTGDPVYLAGDPDPGGRRGMMARLLIGDQALTTTNCLAICQ